MIKQVALVQINPTLGDFKGNAQKIVESAKKSVTAGCETAIFPELALFGYNPVDLLEHEYLVNQQLEELKNLIPKLPDTISIVLGVMAENPSIKHMQGKSFCNAACVIEPGKKPQLFYKTLLPAYDVFDEARHIEPGNLNANIWHYKNKNILVTVCEDIWAWPSFQNKKSRYPHNPLLDVKKKVDLILNLSASPFDVDKMSARLHMAQQTVQHFKAPLIYVNMVGAQDELIFDGRSFFMPASGDKATCGYEFSESISICDLDLNTFYNELSYKPKDKDKGGRMLTGTASTQDLTPPQTIKNQAPKNQSAKQTAHKKNSRQQTTNEPTTVAASSQPQKVERFKTDDCKLIRKALLTGLHDFVKKTGFKKVHLGLSGGIDSALVATLATDILGPEAVTAYALTSPYNTDDSLQFAHNLAQALGIELREIKINNLYNQLKQDLKSLLFSNSTLKTKTRSADNKNPLSTYLRSSPHQQTEELARVLMGQLLTGAIEPEKALELAKQLEKWDADAHLPPPLAGQLSTGGADASMPPNTSKNQASTHNTRTSKALPASKRKTSTKEVRASKASRASERKTSTEKEHVRKSASDLNQISQQNLQARVRAVLLMGVSNQNNSLLLNTSNKSELAMGYGTLYGDLTGGLCVLGDVFKTQVFQLARLYLKPDDFRSHWPWDIKYRYQKMDWDPDSAIANALAPIIARAPSAELWPDQKDEDTLPPYEQLDPILYDLIVKAQAPQNQLERSILKQVVASEFKRWQSPPVLKISPRAFGRGRRHPLVGLQTSACVPQ